MEYIFAVGLGGLLVAVLVAFSMHNARSFAILTNLVDIDQASRMTQAQMTRDFRQVQRLQSYSTNDLTFLDYDGKILRYFYDQNARKLYRIKDGVRRAMLSECDKLGFSILQRNIKAGTFEYYPATKPDTCKVVGVDWTCTRTMVGQKVNLTSSQSARIAIRKH